MTQLFKTAGVVVAAAAIAFVGFNAGAASAVADGAETGILHRVHDFGRRLHGIHSTGHGSGVDRHLDKVAEVLALRPDQVDQARTVFDAFMEQRDAYHVSMEALHEGLLAQLANGRLDADGLKQALDGRLDAMREATHAAVDEAVALADSLDTEQRERALRHFAEVEDRNVF